MDINTEVIGSSYRAKSILKEESAATAGGDAGVAVFAIRKAQTGAYVSEGDYTRFATDSDNRLYVNPFGSGEGDFWQAALGADITDTTSTQLRALVAAKRIYVTHLSFSNTSAVGSRVDILDGATVIAQGYLPAAASGGQLVMTFPTPLRLTAATALNVQLATTATATRASGGGFISAN
jgi:hypothetical protein